MITKRSVAIPTVLEDGQVQLREDTVFEEDGKEVFRSHHRRVLVPGDDVTNESPLVKSVCAAVWTKEVVDKYKADKAARDAKSA